MGKLNAFFKHPIVAGVSATLIVMVILGLFAWVKGLLKSRGDILLLFNLPFTAPFWVWLVVCGLVTFSLVFALVIWLKDTKKHCLEKDPSEDCYDEDFFWDVYWQWDAYFSILDTNCELTARCPICSNEFDAYSLHCTSSEEAAVRDCCSNCKYPATLGKALNISHWGARKEIDRRIHNDEVAGYKNRIEEMKNVFRNTYKAEVAKANAEKNQS